MRGFILYLLIMFDNISYKVYSRDHWQSISDARSARVEIAQVIPRELSLRVQLRQVYRGVVSCHSVHLSWASGVSGRLKAFIDIAVRFLQDDPWSKDDNRASKPRDGKTEDSCDRCATRVLDVSAVDSPTIRAICKPWRAAQETLGVFHVDALLHCRHMP